MTGEQEMLKNNVSTQLKQSFLDSLVETEICPKAKNDLKLESLLVGWKLDDKKLQLVSSR